MTLSSSNWPWDRTPLMALGGKPSVRDLYSAAIKR